MNPDFVTNRVFPEFESRVRRVPVLPREMEPVYNNVFFAAKVRIKRGGKYYFIEQTYNRDISIDSFNEYHEALMYFFDMCQRAKYLFVIPEDEKDFERMRIKRDISHLSDKEEFLLRTHGIG